MTLQLGLAGISMYLLGRTLNANHLGAFLAGVVFQLSGFLVISAVHPMIVAAASWLPLLLALVDLTVRRAPFFGTQRAMLPWALLGAIAWAGNPGRARGITYFTLLVMGCSRRGGWRTRAHAPRRDWRSDVLSPAIACSSWSVWDWVGAVQLLRSTRSCRPASARRGDAERRARWPPQRGSSPSRPQLLRQPHPPRDARRVHRATVQAAVTPTPTHQRIRLGHQELR
jgi:hypothetical protein